MDSATRTTEQEQKDMVLPGACALCGGDLAVRITASVARSCCVRCRWISSPRMQRMGDEIVMVHAAGGLA